MKTEEPVEPKRAYIYFWDGHRFGARIVTDAGRNLEQRIRKVVNSTSWVGTATAMFAAYDMAEGIHTEIWPPPPARTISQSIQAAESASEWPGNQNGKAWPAGVFIVNVVTGNCRVTGGLGFSGTVDTCNPSALREFDLIEEGDEDEGGS